jgi:L-cysteate sulfo-lyase
MHQPTKSLWWRDSKQTASGIPSTVHMDKRSELEASMHAQFRSRVSLAHLPTPLVELHRLTNFLEGPRIFMKRDDCTGLAGGGNKTRKLELLIGDVLEQECDVVITTGGVQSNHCRQTAAAAARYGLKCHLVLTRNVDWDDPAYTTSGNLVLDRVLGAEITIHPMGFDRDQYMEDLAQDLRGKGYKPYIIPLGGSNALGAVGHIATMLEIQQQCHEQEIAPKALYHCTSSGGTQAGLVSAMIATKRPFPVFGVENENDVDHIQAVVEKLVPETLDRLGLPTAMRDDDVRIVEGYGGPAYGIPTEGTLEAIKLLARMEGILLDPVYTGKGMAGLIGDICAAKYGKDDVVIFLHTGGAQVLGAYPSLFPGS